ncbi:MAG: fibro-slime domain-containing protein [Myxococcales bacterium]|nr:MAG: fibro-slime domain-containing protein [Myxococcales bacterium]
MTFSSSAGLALLKAAACVALLPLAGCSAAAEDTGSAGAGGKGSPVAGTSSGAVGNAPPLQTGGSIPDLGPIDSEPTEPEECKSVLELTIRDFTAMHPDFEAYRGINDAGCGMVAPTIGPDSKPTFVSGLGTMKRVISGDFSNAVFTACAPWDWSPGLVVITSQDTFNQWYRDVEGMNQTFTVPITLLDAGDGTGNVVYDSKAFFPIDDMGFGNTPNQQHNFSFTTEGHVKFEYIKGQKFTFRGDDDLWIYVNGKLALDLGGTHVPIAATLDFDVQAASLGIVPGGNYQMDIFHAERHTSESNFRVETNIRCFEPVPVVR